MITLETYRRLGLLDEEDVFTYLISTLKDSNQTFDYFVDWGTVFNNVGEIEKQLNILNYLIGKENIEDEFRLLIKEYPEIVNVIPVFLAIRAKSLKVLVDYKQKDWVYKEYFFRKKSKYTDEEIDDIIDFCQLSGFLKLLEDRKIKNLVDYCIGMEVGIGTNGRKNRSGDIMEGIMDWHIKNTCEKLNLQYIKQGTRKDTMAKWGIKLPIDRANRIHDFIINKDGKLVIIETNFYSVSGSKLKATAGEYQELHKFLNDKEEVHSFIWITDGIGWQKTQGSLKEAFTILDYLFNIKLVSHGALEEILR